MKLFLRSFGGVGEPGVDFDGVRAGRLWERREGRRNFGSCGKANGSVYDILSTERKSKDREESKRGRKGMVRCFSD